MKTLLRLSALLTALLCLSISGCKNDEVAPPPTDNGLGRITGFVIIYNESDFFFRGHQGADVHVTLRDTALAVVGSTTTDSSGNWELRNIPAGTYECVLEKDGYGTTTYLGFVYSGREDITTFRSTAIGQIPSFEVDSLAATVTTDSLLITGSVSNDASYRRLVLLYFGSDSSVSSRKYIRDYYFSMIQPGSRSFRLSISLQYLTTFYFMDPHVQAWIAGYTYVPGSTIGPYGNLYYQTSIGSLAKRTSFMMP